MRKVLDSRFFNRATLIVARELLSCFLCRRIGKRNIRRRIIEVEAYNGPKDRASHAHRGETPRNRVMFGKGGVWYVYFTYGMHWMLNVVTGPIGYPAAVLIRGVEGVEGPARVTKFFKIGRKHNRTRASRQSGLWIESSGAKPLSQKIKATPRVGVAYAGKWSEKPYRFVLKST